MAIQANQPGLDDEEKKKDVSSIPSSSAPTGVGAPSAGGATAPSGSSQGPSSSGAYTDIGKYIEANRPVIGKLAERTVGGIEQKAQAAQEGIAEQAQEVEQSIQEQQKSADPFTGKKASEIVGSNFEEARDVLQGGYEGPAAEDISLTGLFDLQQAEKAADLGQSFGGRQTLLREQIAPQVKDYSRGESLLDAALLSRDPASRERLSQLSQDFGGQLGQAEARLQALRDLAGTTKEDNLAASQQLRDQLSNQLTILGKGGPADRTGQIESALSNYLGDIFREMKQSRTIWKDEWSPEQQALYNEFYQQPMQEGELSGGFGGIGGGLESSFALNAAKELLSRYREVNADPLQGLTSQQAGEYEAIQDLLGGISDTEGMRETAQDALSSGVYDEQSALDKLIDYWNNLGRV